MTFFEKDGGLFCELDIEEGLGGTIVFTFSDYEMHKLEISGNLHTTVNILKEEAPAGGKIVEFSGRLNIKSLSARSGYANELNKCLAMRDFKSAKYLSEAIIQFEKYLRTSTKSILLASADIEKIDPIFDPFIAPNAHTIIFGKGSGGKTFLSLRILLSLLSGKPMLGFTPKQKMNAMFLDYEDNEGTARDRVDRLCGDPFFRPELDDIYQHLWYRNARGIPLYDLTEELKKDIKEHNIGVMLIDSIVPACGGAPESAEIAGRYFNALSTLGISTISIGHETKSENHAYPFGSVFFYNTPRNIWNVQSQNDDSNDDIRQIQLQHIKSNNGRLMKNIPVQIEFNTGHVAVKFGNSLYWDKDRPCKDRILEILKTGSKTFKQLQEDLDDVPLETLRTTLKRLRGNGKIFCSGQGGSYELLREIPTKST